MNCKTRLLCCSALCACAFAALPALAQAAKGESAVEYSAGMPAPAQAPNPVDIAEPVPAQEPRAVEAKPSEMIEVDESLPEGLPQNEPLIVEGAAGAGGESPAQGELPSAVAGDDLDGFIDSLLAPVPEEEPYYGWKISASATGANPNRVEAATFDGRKASITVGGGFVSEQQLQAVGRALDAAWLIPNLKVRQASVYIEDDSRFRFVLFPSEFFYESLDLCRFLPSGIAFSYDGALFYDVVLKCGGVKPRISGVYVEPEDFAALLYKAALMPELFVNATLQERVNRLEKALLSLSSRGFYGNPRQIDDEVLQAVKKLYNEDNTLTKKDIIAKLKEQDIKCSASDVDAIFVVLFGVYE